MSVVQFVLQKCRVQLLRVYTFDTNTLINMYMCIVLQIGIKWHVHAFDVLLMHFVK